MEMKSAVAVNAKTEKSRTCKLFQCSCLSLLSVCSHL